MRFDPGEYIVSIHDGSVDFVGRSGTFRSFPVFQDEETGEQLIPLEAMLLMETLKQANCEFLGVDWIPEGSMN